METPLFSRAVCLMCGGSLDPDTLICPTCRISVINWSKMRVACTYAAGNRDSLVDAVLIAAWQRRALELKVPITASCRNDSIWIFYRIGVGIPIAIVHESHEDECYIDLGYIADNRQQKAFHYLLSWAKVAPSERHYVLRVLEPNGPLYYSERETGLFESPSLKEIVEASFEWLFPPEPARTQPLTSPWWKRPFWHIN